MLSSSDNWLCIWLQVVLLGSAPDPRIQNDFVNLANQLHSSHGDCARLCLTYDEPLSHLVCSSCYLDSLASVLPQTNTPFTSWLCPLYRYMLGPISFWCRQFLSRADWLNSQQCVMVLYLWFAKLEVSYHIILSFLHILSSKNSVSSISETFWQQESVLVFYSGMSSYSCSSECFSYFSGVFFWPAFYEDKCILTKVGSARHNKL